MWSYLGKRFSFFSLIFQYFCYMINIVFDLNVNSFIFQPLSYEIVNKLNPIKVPKGKYKLKCKENC